MIRHPVADAGLPERLARQLEFCLELDRVKQVLRRNTLTDGSRRENDAEHLWHVAVMAAVLAEHADEPVDVARVMTMLLLHDVVEIDAGDAFLYDAVACAAAVEKERVAAERIFGLLPVDQAVELRSLWEEFEQRSTADARFARALDRLQPMLLNAAGGGGGWRDNGVVATQVAANEAVVARGSASLAAVARAVVDGAVADGILPGPLAP
ncbi:MAG TPA: HD domain-containing protein [Acidimicrobiales bacterium]|nr:HD domain-containing protein [Acidimicrobiales bacterium]